MFSCPPPIAHKPAESAGLFYVLIVSDHTMTTQIIYSHFFILFPTESIQDIAQRISLTSR